MKKGDMVTCAHCGRTESLETEPDEMQKEADALGLADTLEDGEQYKIVCDDCWEANMPKAWPATYKKYKDYVGDK